MEFCCSQQNWCFENFVNYRNLTYAVEVRKQLAELCERTNIPMKSCTPLTEPVRRCLLAGLFLSVAEYQREGHYLTVSLTIAILFKFVQFVKISVFFSAWVSPNCYYPPVVGFVPFETFLHRVHRAHSNGETLRPSSDSHRSRLDRRLTQRNTFTTAPGSL